MVARILFARFLDLFEGRFPTASQILETPLSQIRSIGISQRKAEYLKNVAAFIVENKISFGKVQKLKDEQVIELLTQIKGVGRWTVEMLLIFGVAREDVFAVDDLSIQKAMIELYGLHDLPKRGLREKMLLLSQKWSPYRTYVCLYFWKFSSLKK